ncbi:MAG: XTP/dITP diphosphatase [Ruminococcaceae bacterium]|nr:XTP/dITP diphosphatase [Oscillospiraceae bacterium]MBQ8324875.1 XTP/dITP diphosphatase [Clostridia bacterium]MBQ8911692.1 XTP/dITP diphosphatase [Clostridia bacterium]
MKKVILASDNAHKLEEFRRYFREAEIPLEIIPLRESGFSGDIVEDGATFEENALIKARTVSLATGCMAIADDSGLEVDALNGAPGVHSARYAGIHGDDAANNAKLLAELEGVPEEGRTARFVSAVCVFREDGEHLTVRGTAEGRILKEKQGSGTFGYDPLFYYPPFGKTFAELSGTEKNSVSHRGNALTLLMKKRDFFLK